MFSRIFSCNYSIWVSSNVNKFFHFIKNLHNISFFYDLIPTHDCRTTTLWGYQQNISTSYSEWKISDKAFLVATNWKLWYTLCHLLNLISRNKKENFMFLLWNMVTINRYTCCRKRWRVQYSREIYGCIVELDNLSINGFVVNCDDDLNDTNYVIFDTYNQLKFWKIDYSKSRIVKRTMHLSLNSLLFLMYN